MKRILELICEPVTSGGEEAFLINLTKSINQTDFKIELYAPFGFFNDYYKTIFKDYNVSVYDKKEPLNPNGFRINLLFPLYNFLKSEKYDVIHIHSSQLSPLAIASLSSKMNNIEKIILHSHSSGLNNVKHKIAKLLLNPLFFICPTDFIACSMAAGESKFPKFVVKNKLEIIKNGIDLDRFNINEEKRDEYRNKLGCTDDDMIIGHVGRFSDEKNHEFIIDLFSELHKKDNRYKLLLVGDGELKDSIQSKAEALGLSDFITFTGNVDNVQDYMQAIDLFILPSKYEGLGIVGVEAQACGLPCIFSTGVPEEAKLTDNVEFLSLEDKNQWIETVEKMIKMPKSDNTEIIRTSGYDIKDTARRLEEIYLSR